MNRLATVGQACIELGPFSAPGPHRPISVKVAGRELRTTAVFDTYWYFAAARHALYEARQADPLGPWTDDPILRSYRFTNCFRAADRVSQFLIREVAYGGPQDPENLAFRILLFKFFNKIDTWRTIVSAVGEPSKENFNPSTWSEALGEAAEQGVRLYSAAYVIPPPKLGASRKHVNHLRLLDHMMQEDVAGKLRSSESMSSAFALLRRYPSMGDFLAFQFTIDLNYSSLLDFDEMEFVVAGPGARDGIRKCFGREAGGIESEIIRYMADSQEEHFERLGLQFNGLKGRRLHLIDCQNLFCETDKYARMAHPDIAGISGRTRIKQRFVPISDPLTAWFPPKWQIN